jgi:lysophospholipase L1-like esterase
MLILVLSCGFSYALFEALFYVAILTGIPVGIHPFYNLAAWSEPIAKYDAVIGYRLDPKLKYDGIRILKNDLQFYYKNIKINSSGFKSNYEYIYKKEKEHRVVVYGDSFTAGLYQSRSWPETLQKNLLAAGTDIEVYNFSFDGGGVFNWNRHYFKELKGRYEFDTVIFAICCNDLNRGLATYHADQNRQQILYQKFNNSVDTLIEFEKILKPKMSPALEIMSPQKLQKISEYMKSTEPTILETMEIIDFDLYGAKAINKVILPFIAFLESWGYNWGKPIKDKVFNTLKFFGGATNESQKKLSNKVAKAIIKKDFFTIKPTYEYLLFQMIDDLLASNKKIILLTIPADKNYILRGQKGKSLSHFPHDVFKNQKIAIKKRIPHLSGYDVFKDVNPQILKKYWPSYDGHWLQSGSDFFADEITPQIKEIIEAPLDKKANVKKIYSVN